MKIEHYPGDHHCIDANVSFWDMGVEDSEKLMYIANGKIADTPSCQPHSHKFQRALMTQKHCIKLNWLWSMVH